MAKTKDNNADGQNASHLAEEINIERERLTSLINSMGDGVIAIEADGTIAITNGAALNILDSNESLNGRSLYGVLQLVDQANQLVDLRSIIEDSKTSYTTRDWRIHYSEDESAHLYISISPVRLGYGKDGMHGYVLLIRDITREKSLEEERDEFISVVSHELRTPIAIAEGNISNAVFLYDKADHDDPAVAQALTQAQHQIEFLAVMMNDLATLSRAERGKLQLDVETIDVHELIEELVETYKEDADKKSLELHQDIPDGIGDLHSSRLYTNEILQNFITNAIKYTEEGSVIIGARRKEKGVEFYVDDTGIGISKTDREKVFDKFFRSEDYRTRKNTGTGLGLYVAMKLARLIHAEISMTSEINKGSCFKIFVPHLSPIEQQ